mmetsp:Transcript_57107/g.167183  ORF Transcript_57107/g.167183 Transcript_57107/m.167183 type:complete len:338 (+) Transcript_57107:14-1027(+)
MHPRCSCGPSPRPRKGSLAVLLHALHHLAQLRQVPLAPRPVHGHPLRLHVDLQGLHEGALDAEDNVVVACVRPLARLLALPRGQEGCGGRRRRRLLAAHVLVDRLVKQEGDVGHAHVARAVVEALAGGRRCRGPGPGRGLRLLGLLLPAMLQRLPQLLVGLVAAVGLLIQRGACAHRLHVGHVGLHAAVDARGGHLCVHAFHLLQELRRGHEGCAFHLHGGRGLAFLVRGAPELLDAVRVAAGAARLAAAVAPPAAELRLVDVVRGSQLLVPVRELALAVAAPAAEEVVAELRLRQVGHRLQLLLPMREGARAAQGALILLVEDAQLRLVELLPDLG